jgi:AraC-like DNA-binding protein
MLAQHTLNLRLIRLKSPEEWIHKGEELAFVFPKGGVGNCVSGPVTHRLASGDVLVLDATSGGKLSVPDRREMVFWYFSLRLEHLFPLFASNEICLLQNVTDGFKGAKLYPAASALAQECHRLLAESPAQFDLNHRSHLLRVIAAILTLEFNTAKAQRVGFVRAGDHMIQVFEKLSTVELLSLPVCELANKFGCSRRHLGRLFHQYFGVSVAALKMELRLLKAVSLLRNPDAKVIRVAEDCGFNHLGLFNTCFKRRFGVSPGAWRKQTPRSENQPKSQQAMSSTCPLHPKGLCPMVGGAPHNNLVPLAPPSPQIQKTGGAKVLPGIHIMNREIQQNPRTNENKLRSSITEPVPI